ncbi:hypothetical protein [Kutzneria kofuensis]|uniref:Uncharacterized protein n=1 Tax=Kutzneria kofuensis TaxID=103725 RepID=A0A7W9NEC2_9PSEU|nr:hypothetical protein [Kutzneria kofuensis]MBB5889254.1 hypothetical protein [Kutzneria kofuensis]
MRETKTGRAVLVVLGWHVVIAAGLLIWIANQHSTTGSRGFSISTQTLLWLGVFVYGIPAWLMSLGVGSVSVLLLNRRLGHRPVPVGTLATLLGLLAVAACTFVLIALRN